MKQSELEAKIRELKLKNVSRDDCERVIKDFPENGDDPEHRLQLVDAIYREQVEPCEDKGLHLTDMGNAQRFVMQQGDNIRYCYERNKWLIWNGKNWQWDNGYKITELAKQTVLTIYNEVSQELNFERRKSISKHAINSESDSKIQAMINLAQSEPGIPIKVTDLDANPYLFNVQNGTIDLHTGQLHPHRKEDLQSIIVPIDYQPDAPCPIWKKFLIRVTADKPELTAYLQRAVGVSLTGDVKCQVLFFVYGLGNNGKSTFIIIIRKLTSEYGERVNTDLFMLKEKNISGPKEGLANLRGKRFVCASELEDGRRLAVGLIKDMTGGETIKADRKYEHEIEYQPTHKLWLVGNHKPQITDTTLSIWRRVKLIPFTVTIPHKEIDPDLSIKLEKELPGILAWAVKGCLDWQKNGLNEPDIVIDATSAYRHESDILGDFIEDCCILEPLANIAKSELKELYQTWCQVNSSEPVTQKTFKNRLVERGITDYKGTGGQRFWRGIKAKNPNDSGKTSDNSCLSGTQGSIFQENTIEKSSRNNFIENSATPATPATILPPIPEYPCPKCGKEAWGYADDKCTKVKCVECGYEQ